MLATVIAMAVAAQNPAAASLQIPTREKLPFRVCRFLVQGPSARGDIKVCRTKAEWRQWELCNSPTTYCSAEQKAARYGRRTAFALSEDSRVVCRIVKMTGSRLANVQVCLPQREWLRQWEESSATVLKVQDYSKVRTGGGQ
ncbi:MAG: hypothetical protein ABI667_06350 [Sphingomicrobium sp.]